MRRRCGWARDPLDVQHHDEEWGVPEHDDRRLFEFLILEGAQAGLSWLTILRKRDAYRRAFAGFDPERVTRFSESDVRRLLEDPGIVRNRAKIEAAIGNARGVRAVQREYGSFASYVWRFVGGTPIQNAWTSLSEVPSETDVSRALSRDLATRGFRFVGPTICYAFMQSVGMVNDHVVDCFRWAVVRRLARPGLQDTRSRLSPRQSVATRSVMDSRLSGDDKGPGREAPIRSSSKTLRRSASRPSQQGGAQPRFGDE
jgi:DNA-3-methyladenine glycosylase I